MDNYREIPLTQGKVALIDEADYDRVVRFKWYALRTGATFYALRAQRIEGKQRFFYMHRFLLDNPVGLVVDHMNHDGLDNRQSNLRICAFRENLLNSRIAKHNTSGYKGVSFSKHWNKWLASITVNYKDVFLGWHSTPEAAAHAYDNAAVKAFGPFASTNATLGLLPVSQ